MQFRGDFGFGEPNRLLQASVLAKFGPRRVNSDNESSPNIVFSVPAYYEVEKCLLESEFGYVLERDLNWGLYYDVHVFDV